MKRTAQILFIIPAVLVLFVAIVVQLNDGRVPVGWKQNTDSHECFLALNDNRHCAVPADNDGAIMLAGCTDDAFFTGEPYTFIHTDEGNCITEYNIFANVLNAMTGFFIVFYVLFFIGWLIKTIARKAKAKQ